MYGPTWPFLFTYGSRDMRHRLSQVDGGQRDPREMGRHGETPLSGTGQVQAADPHSGLHI